jgi:hypothetical protein
VAIPGFRRYALHVRLVSVFFAIALTSVGCASSSSPQTPHGSTGSGGQWLFAATTNPDPNIKDPGAVIAFAPPFPYGSPKRITNGVSHPGAIATNPLGDLFVNSLGTSTIAMFTNPYNGQPHVLPGKFRDSQLAFDKSGDLFVLTNAGSSPSSLIELKPPYDKAVVLVRNTNEAASLALDSRDDVLVDFYGHSGNTLKMYVAPGYTTIGATLQFSGNVAAMGVNAGDLLFVSFGASVAVYTIKPKAIVPLHKPFDVGCGGFQMAVPPSGDVFVSNGCSSIAGVNEIASPAFDQAVSLPALSQYTGLLAVDSTGNLYIVGQNDVWISQPPYSSLTTTSSLHSDGQISSVALGPAQ